MKRIIPYILFVLSIAFITSGFLINSQSNNVWSFNLFRPVGVKEIFKLINDHRKTIKRSVLQENATLCRFANKRLDELLKNNDFSHDNLKKQWSEDPARDYTFIGENLARDYLKDETLMKAWLSSPTHREIIENKRYTHACVIKKENIIIFVAGEKGKQ